MKKIKLAYSDLYNAGDLMNVSIVEKISGAKVIRTKTHAADMTAIGGAIFGLQYSDQFLKRITQFLISFIYENKEIYIWGSGFLHDFNNRPLFRKNLIVKALRGRKTQIKLFNLTGNLYDVPLADAGLLIEFLCSPSVQKKYKIGLIPHMYQQNDDWVKEVLRSKDVHFINIKNTPQNVGYEISLCETILSSSLHGLIFADALHVPNLHIIGQTKLKEGNFKFEDYYSSYGMDDTPITIENHIPSASEIQKLYAVPYNEIEYKKKALVDCFPYEAVR